jgi:hypothetical protein
MSTKTVAFIHLYLSALQQAIHTVAYYSMLARPPVNSRVNMFCLRLPPPLLVFGMGLQNTGLPLASTLAG